MAMRRPRIKAAANLANIKRKAKVPVQTNTDNSNNATIACPSVDSEVQHEKKDKNVQETHVDKIQVDEPIDKAEEKTEISANKIEIQTNEVIVDDVAFKEPAKLEYQRLFTNNTSHINTTLTKSDDEFIHCADIDDNVIQIDLQKSSNGFPLSPSKQQIRARIRPLPIMGQRRNSYVASSPSPHINEDSGNEFIMPSPRRERFHSTSFSSFNGVSGASPAYSPQKYVTAPTPVQMQARTRTESTCSNYSDLFSALNNNVVNTVNGTKTRRQQNTDHNIRLQWRRDYESRCTKGVPDKGSLKMLDLLFYNPVANPMEVKEINKHNMLQKEEHETDAEETELIKEQNKEKLEQKPIKTNHAPVPQLKLNANNELVLDDKSLVIETTAEQEARKMIANTSLVFVDENTGMNGFYSKQKRTKDWTHEETIKFYRCLQTVGTDFSLMGQLFPKRTRRELKLKYKKEERCNGALINKALYYPKVFNVTELKEQLEAEERKYEEEKQKWLEIQKQRAIKIKKARFQFSQGANSLKNGLEVYENEHLLPKSVSSRTEYSKNENNSAANGDKNVAAVISPETKQALKTHFEKTLALRILEASANDTTSTEEIVKRPRKRRNQNVTMIEKEKKLRKSRAIAEIVEDTETNEEVNAKELEQDLTLLLNTETKTFVDLDNGESVKVFEMDGDKFSEHSFISSVNDKISNATKKEEITEKSSEDYEATIQHIFEQIEQGGLVLVSSIDPYSTDNVINEIYVLDKTTNELSDKPLDLPEEILQAISTLAS